MSKTHSPQKTNPAKLVHQKKVFLAAKNRPFVALASILDSYNTPQLAKCQKNLVKEFEDQIKPVKQKREPSFRGFLTPDIRPFHPRKP